MNSSMGWESNRKKAPVLWEKYDYQFPRFSAYNGFCCFFVQWEIDGETYAFPI